MRTQAGGGGWFDEYSSLQPLQEYYARFPFIDDPDRRANTAMVAFMDEIVGNITAGLRARAMWEKTFVVWSSDNVRRQTVVLGCSAARLTGIPLQEKAGV